MTPLCRLRRALPTFGHAFAHAPGADAAKRHASPCLRAGWGAWNRNCSRLLTEILPGTLREERRRRRGLDARGSMVRAAASLRLHGETIHASESRPIAPPLRPLPR